MAPVSILPGRVRYADGRLIGNELLAAHLENNLGPLPGIGLVSASHRTGSILVEFNEFDIDRNQIARQITSLLGGVLPQPTTAASGKNGTEAAAQRAPRASSRFIAHMALHLILPAPFDLLLPALRRS